ncbi:MAG: alpha-E domain-containing protein [Flavobacteriaceae bacterium]|jgi:uncharacterized alpha-E superfamily protein
MLSRVANNLFWMDRYIERSYGLLNLIKTNFNSTLDSGDYSSWNNILSIYLGIDKNQQFENYQDSLSIIKFILFDKNNANTHLNMIINARENARSVQEHISRELWLSVNKYYLHFSNTDIINKYENDDPITFVNDLLLFNHIYYSVADITQERGNAYCFMNLGKYLERVVQSIDFISVRINTMDLKNENIYESFFWKNLLISIGGYQLYLKKYKSIFGHENIIEMIALNENFPRSIKYSVNKLHIHIERLYRFNNLEDNQLLFKIGKLKNHLNYTTIENIKEEGIDAFLFYLQSELREISSIINKTFFYQIQ